MPCYDVQDDTRVVQSSGQRADAIPDASTWKCAACNEICSSEVLPLRHEKQLAELVPQVMQGPAEDATADAVQLGNLRLKVAQVLGVNHWTWVLATFAWLQKCLIRLRTHNVISFNEASMHAASQAVVKWLQVAAPDNVEQRMSAVFIAARLARELGEGVRSWGYDPARPLGGELEEATRICMTGWTLTEEAVIGPDEVRQDVGDVVPHRSAKANQPRFVAEWA